MAQRLIDADALAKFIDYGHLNNPDEKHYSENDIREMIDMMPTIAEPVRHGKWIEVEDSMIRCRCSVCGWESHLYEDDVYGMPYCPNCGAYMRGDTNE